MVSGRPDPSSRRPVMKRIVRALTLARLHERNRPVSRRGRLASFLVVALAGFMIAVGAVNARGNDLRANRNDDLLGTVQDQAARNRALAAQAAALRSELDNLSASAGSSSVAVPSQMASANMAAGLTAVKGPAVQVTLSDAPASVQPVGVDADLLVVHQQDIQMVMNVLWSAGAEAMTLQGQRVISTTGVKCVGNSVVIKGVPYSPPYVVTAIGDQARLIAALNISPGITIYKQYVTAYSLGYGQTTIRQVVMPAYSGSLDLGSAVAGR